MVESPGPELALLLLAGFHSMVDEVTAELATRGHEGVRPVHDFALRAIDAGADNASELGRRQGVSKQAAAKTIAALERLGYAERDGDPADGRRKRVRVTRRGRDMMSTGEAFFNEVRAQWAARIGADQLDTLQGHLRQLTAHQSWSIDELARHSADDGTGA